MKWYKGIMEGTQRKQHSCDFYYYNFSDNCFATISVCFSFDILIKVKHLLGLVCWPEKQNKQSNHRFHASLLKWIASKKDKILQDLIYIWCKNKKLNKKTPQNYFRCLAITFRDVIKSHSGVRVIAQKKFFLEPIYLSSKNMVLGRTSGFKPTSSFPL